MSTNLNETPAPAMTRLEAELIFDGIDTPSFLRVYTAWTRTHPGQSPAAMFRELADALEPVAPNAGGR